MEEENKKNPLKIVLVIVLLVVAFVGGFLLSKVISGDKKEEPKEEEKEETPKENKVISEDVEKLMRPFLSINNCGGLNNYIKEKTTFDTISEHDKLAMAYLSLGYSTCEHEVTLEELTKEYQKLFGKDKTPQFPNRLEIVFNSLDLEGDKYVSAGCGGGCICVVKTEGGPLFQIYSTITEKDKLVVKVNYAFLETNCDSATEKEEWVGNLYSSPEKTKLLKGNLKHNDYEEIIKNTMSSDTETDYILFTFNIIEGHYIFESANIVKR